MNKIHNVTIVDDDKLFAFKTKKAIESTNLVEQIRIFGNGLEFITFLMDSINNHEPLSDIILLDLNMPIMDGWQFLEEFIVLPPRLNKKILVYVVSSSIAEQDIERAKALSSVSDFIVKPVSKDKILHVLKNL